MPLHPSPNEPPRQLHAVNKLEQIAGRAYADTIMPTMDVAKGKIWTSMICFPCQNYYDRKKTQGRFVQLKITRDSAKFESIKANSVQFPCLQFDD